MFDTSSKSSESPMAACNDDAQPLESSVNHEDMSQAIRENEQVEEPIEEQEEGTNRNTSRGTRRPFRGFSRRSNRR